MQLDVQGPSGNVTLANLNLLSELKDYPQKNILGYAVVDFDFLGRRVGKEVSLSLFVLLCTQMDQGVLTFCKSDIEGNDLVLITQTQYLDMDK